LADTAAVGVERAKPYRAIVATVIAGWEMGTVQAFLTEHSPRARRGYYSGWVLSSIGFAVLLGAASGTFVTAVLDSASLTSWGWRVPFLLGLLIGPFGFYFRSRMEETLVYEKAAHSDTDSPLRESVTMHAHETFSCFAMVMLNAWQQADISKNVVYRGDLSTALAAISAQCLVMPSVTDMYFSAREITDEARAIPHADIWPIDTILGYRVNNTIQNPTDVLNVETHLRSLLGNKSN